MPDKDCPLCQAKVKNRVTHQHSPMHFRSPANPHGGQPGWWHDVRWSDHLNAWVCDARCCGGYGKTCAHIKEVIAILKDEFEAWLGEVPRRPRVEAYPIDRALTDALTMSGPAPVKRLEDLYPD